MNEPSGAPGTRPPSPARHPPSSRVVRWLDRGAAVALLLGLSVAVFGGIRFDIGRVRVSASTPWLLLSVGAILTLIRLRLQPYASVAARTQTSAAASRILTLGRDTKPITEIFLATRVGVIVLAFVAVATVGVAPEARGMLISENPLLNLSYRWDSGWYLAIAVDGYHWDPVAGSTRQQSVAFFPAYPLLMRMGGAVLGARVGGGSRTRATLERLRSRTLVAGWLLALGASYAGLHSLFRWTEAVADRRTALRAVMLLSAYPFAIYFSAAYTEALFLLCVLEAFNAMRTERPGTAGAWGLLCGLVRPNGFLVALPLLLLASRNGIRRWRPLVAAVMPIVGMLIFSACIWSLTGRPFAWMEAHAAWGRTPPTWEGAVTRPLEEMAREGMIGYAASAPYQLLNGAAVLFSLSLLPAVWRKLGAPSALFVVVMIVPPLFAGGLMSMGRLTSTLFPVFVALAQIIPRRQLTTWIIAFAMAQGVATVLFFTWRPLV